MVNRGNFTASETVSFERIGLPVSAVVKVADLWTGSTKCAAKEVTASKVPSHDTAILRLSGFGGSQSVIPTGMVFNTYSLNVLSVTGKSVQWVSSTGTSSGQVWQTRSDNTLRSTSDISLCLIDLGAGDMGVETCAGGRLKVGTTISRVICRSGAQSGASEPGSGEATTSKCLFEAISQVFGLPSGMIILQS